MPKSSIRVMLADSVLPMPNVRIRIFDRKFCMGAPINAATKAMKIQITMKRKYHIRKKIPPAMSMETIHFAICGN